MENPTDVQTPQMSQAPVKKTPMEMVQLGIAAIVAKVKSLLPKPAKTSPQIQVASPSTSPSVQSQQNAETQAVSQAKLWTHAVPPSIPSKVKFPVKKIVVALIGLLVLFILLMVLSKLFKVSLPIDNPLDFSTPTPSPTVIPTTPPISKYATDSAVLKLEQDINTLDQELLNVDLDEDSLKPRPLKFDINFQ